VDESEVTEVSYNIKASELRFSRRRSDSGSEGLKTCKLEPEGGKTLKFHIFVDTSFLEVFVDEGRACMTNNIYPQSEIRDIDLFTRGGKVKLMSLDLWKLKSINYFSWRLFNERRFK
jgi:sucrose-6-phosphate hydrolase SacC (GH32 family)